MGYVVTVTREGPSTVMRTVYWTSAIASLGAIDLPDPPEYRIDVETEERRHAVASFFALGDVERDSIVSQIRDVLRSVADSEDAVRERLTLVQADPAQRW